MLEMQLKYRNKFVNARQHITALPPLSDSQIEVNHVLQKLANHTGSNYITTKAFRDRITGQMRRNLIHGIHYNDVGVKTLAREIKKSLFSESNISNTCLTTLNQMEQTIASLNHSTNQH